MDATTSGPTDAPREDVEDVVRKLTDQFPHLAGSSTSIGLEALASLIVRLRAVRARIDADGVIVKDDRGKVIAHPAITVEQKLADQVRAMSARIARSGKVRRGRNGYMEKHTRASVHAAEHIDENLHAASIAEALSYAVLIDEAQALGYDEFAKMAYGALPGYQKACAALRIRPADVPSAAPVPGQGEQAGGLGALRGALGLAG